MHWLGCGRVDQFTCVDPLNAKHDYSRFYFALLAEHTPLFERMRCVYNPFNPEFTIVIFIHYKPRIAVAILDL